MNYNGFQVIPKLTKRRAVKRAGANSSCYANPYSRLHLRMKHIGNCAPINYCGATLSLLAVAAGTGLSSSLFLR